MGWYIKSETRSHREGKGEVMPGTVPDAGAFIAIIMLIVHILYTYLYDEYRKIDLNRMLLYTIFGKWCGL